MPLMHLDVKTAYLHGELEEELFMHQPPGFEVPGKEHLVCRLRKSIYGLKQSARCWNRRLHEVLVSMGFKRSSADPCLYTKSIGDSLAYLLVYVDDLVLGCMDKSVAAKIIEQLKRKLDISSLGELKYFLGMEIERIDGKYSISLRGYIEKLAARFGMSEAKPAKTPMDEGFLKLQNGEKLEDESLYRSLVGALLYVAVHARPDIAISASILGRRVSCPTQTDWTAAKRVVRYLLGTKHWKLSYDGRTGDLLGFTDADWAGDVESRKSTSGFAFLYAGAAISWISRKQSSVTLSSMEAEYVSLSEACQEAIWLRSLLEDFGQRQLGATVIHEDNQSCIAFVKAERATRRSKHIETREQFVRNLCDEGKVRLEYCSTDAMTADILTKPLGAQKQQRFASLMGMQTGPLPRISP